MKQIEGNNGDAFTDRYSLFKVLCVHPNRSKIEDGLNEIKIHIILLLQYTFNGR
jgi:hypothetical protein